MERLTKSGAISGKDINELLDESNENQMCKTKAYYKLQEYEDLEEQGRLIKLPCKVGDTIYYIEDNVIYEFIVYSFDIRPLQEFVCNYEGIRLNFKNIGKTVFLTQAEAEAKLKELRGEENE